MLYDSFCAIYTIVSVLPTAVRYWLLCQLAVHFKCGHLSVYNYTEFFTTSIMNMGASLISTCKLTDTLIKNSHILYMKYTQIHSQNRFFFNKAFCTDFFLSMPCVLCPTALILAPWMLCKSVCLFSGTRCLNETFTWRTGAVFFVSGLEWSQAGARQLVAPSGMFIQNSGIWGRVWSKM